MTAPAFQFYPADWLADANVAMASLEEEGAYIRLLCFAWREGYIPKCAKRCASLIGKGATEKLARVVQGWFKQHPTDDTKMVHVRLEEEREKQRAWRKKSADGGKKGAKTRAAHREKEPPANTSRVVEPPYIPKSNSSSPSLPSSSILETDRRAQPASVEEVKAVAEAFPTLPKPDAEFCAWWWDEGEKRGWTDPQNGQPWKNWKAAFSAAWRGAEHNRQERASRTRAPTARARNTPAPMPVHTPGDERLT